MTRRLSPLALAIATSLLTNSQVFAAGGSHGSNGNLYINISALSAGLVGLDSPGGLNGGDASDSTGLLLTTPMLISTSTVGTNGGNAVSSDDGKGGGAQAAPEGDPSSAV